MDTSKVSAIIPMHNEERTIRSVLKKLQKSNYITQIIVINDASTDNSYEQIKNMSGIEVHTNSINKGKAYCMNLGVEMSKNDFIFFCDADLDKLSATIVDKIIEPVINSEFDMSIGLRDNYLQKALKPFAINSGERILKKELWYRVPAFYKHNFRIEIGLNYYATHYGKGITYQKFMYYQTLKEKKYGFLKGFTNRIGLITDMTLAYLYSYGYDLVKKTLVEKYYEIKDYINKHMLKRV